MPERSDHVRIYGMPDPDNRQPPGEEGMRGEEGVERKGQPDFTHAETLPDGDRVLIEEDNGAVFAEVTGRVEAADSSSR